MRIGSRGWRRLLRVCGAAIAIASCAVARASNSCQSLAGDALLRRVDAHFARCLPSHAKSLDAFTDALITNELDASQRKPLAVVAISSRASLLDRFAASVATALTGSSPTVEAASAVRVLDLADAAASSLATHTLTQTLRHDMAAALSACPQQRTLFLVRNVGKVRGAKLPLLDVFLDPLNGARATLHDTATGRDLDCRHALFVFLYEREEHSGHVGMAWRDYLVAQWRQSAETTQLAAEAFTPQALAGRLTTAVVLDAEAELEAETTRDAVWTLTCELESFVSRLQAAQTLGGVRTLGDPLVPPQYVALVFGTVVLVVGVVLVSAKSFAATGKQKAVDVAVGKTKKSKKKQQQQRKKQQHPAPDSSRLASLRSHDHPVTPETEAKSPTSPELTAAVPPEDKIASPVPKTPTPTKKARAGRGKGKTPASAPAAMATRSRRT